MSENPWQILRDWAQEPENIETIAQAVQSLQKSVTQLNAHLSAAASVSVSSATPSAPALASTTPLPQNLGNLWIVGPNPTSTTIVLRYIGEPNEPLTLSTGIQNLLIGGILLFLSGPAQGYPTIITGAASNGTLTFDPVDHTPNPGDRFVFLSNFAATPGSVYTPGQQGSLPPGGNNTVTIPQGVTVNMDIPGQYANNTITVKQTGSGMITTIKADNMLGSDISITEGDTVNIGTMINSDIISNNNAGGCAISVAGTNVGGGSLGFTTPSGAPYQEATYSWNAAETPTYVDFDLQAGAPGTLTVEFNNSEDAGGGPCTADQPYYSFDGGTPVAMQSTATAQVWTATITIPMESHTLNFSDANLGCTSSFTFSYSQGNMVAVLGNPSTIRINDMLNSGVNVFGDTINVQGDVTANTQIINNGGAAAEGSVITVTGNLTDANIEFSSPVDLVIGTIIDADVTVPSGVSSTTVIQYTGTITEDLTTTATQTTYVGTDLIAGYTAPSSDPSIVLSTTVEPTGVLYVPAGNVAAYTTVTDEGFVKVAGKLITNTITVEAGAQLVIDADGSVELGAFI
jgi:hypothetical protein